jgi:drug/metabolite transporter (DMT)-like permease
VVELSMGRYLLIVAAALGALVSQTLMKQGLKQGGPINVASVEQFVDLMVRILTTPPLLIGYILSFLSGLVWLAVLSRMNLSFASPMLTATYFILLLLSSPLLLREVVTPGQWLGTLLIIAGMFLITRFGGGLS